MRSTRAVRRRTNYCRWPRDSRLSFRLLRSQRRAQSSRDHPPVTGRTCAPRPGHAAKPYSRSGRRPRQALMRPCRRQSSQSIPRLLRKRGRRERNQVLPRRHWQDRPAPCPRSLPRTHLRRIIPHGRRFLARQIRPTVDRHGRHPVQRSTRSRPATGDQAIRGVLRRAHPVRSRHSPAGCRLS